jgi:hypothetical protein
MQTAKTLQPDQSCGIAGGIASATTTAATNVGLNVATLNGIVNANSNAATVTFEYGLNRFLWFYGYSHSKPSCRNN